MKIIRPITITDAMLTASNVAENDYAEFAMGTTYADGDNVIVATGLETLVLDVAPATDWVPGDIITGQTSAETSVVVAKLTSLTYSIRERSGDYTLDEIIGVTGVGGKLADQGAAHPTVTAATDNIHKIYESLTDANAGNYPPTDTTNWLEISSTNRWKAFDTSVGSQTTNAETITYTITPGELFDSVGFLNLSATQVEFALTDVVDGVVYTETVNLLDVTIAGTEPEMDWYAYFFSDIVMTTDFARPGISLYLNTVLTITISNIGSTAAVGAIIIGGQLTLGDTQYNPSVGIRDYSVKSTDSFGNPIIVERAYSKRMSADLTIPINAVAYIQNILARYRTTLLLWIGADDYASTIIYGFYKDFSIVIAYPAYAICSIEIEGMT